MSREGENRFVNTPKEDQGIEGRDEVKDDRDEKSEEEKPFNI